MSLLFVFSLLCLCYQTIVVVEVLSIILTEQNKVGFSSLENQGSTTGSRAVLNTAERYVLYLGQALVEDGTNPGHLEYSRDNLGKYVCILASLHLCVSSLCQLLG